jgi:hypothetical protein
VSSQALDVAQSRTQPRVGHQGAHCRRHLQTLIADRADTHCRSVLQTQFADAHCRRSLQTLIAGAGHGVIVGGLMRLITAPGLRRLRPANSKPEGPSSSYKCFKLCDTLGAKFASGLDSDDAQDQHPVQVLSTNPSHPS